MKIIETLHLDKSIKLQLLNLWNSEYPKTLAYHNLEEFDSYLNNLSDLKHILLAEKDYSIAGWAFTFKREQLTWFGIILSGSYHGHGLGSRILEKLKQTNNVLNGWVIDNNISIKINNKPYKSPLEFYKKNDFKIIASQRLELDKISAVKIRWEKGIR